MHAATIDTGATISVLRAFGPPEVVEFAEVDGGNFGEVPTRGFWMVPLAVHLQANNPAGVTALYPYLQWVGSDGVVLATALSPAGVPGGASWDTTFAIDLHPIVAAAMVAQQAPMPELVLLPGGTFYVVPANGNGGATLTDVRVTVQRYKLIVVDELIEA